MQRDPAGYPDGINLYQYVRSQPTAYLDPQGLAAWKHTNWWNDRWKKKYRQFVASKAKQYMGRPEDCADLTMLVLIDFAEKNGLFLTFWRNDGCIYISKSCKFGNAKSFKDTVFDKVGSHALFNTEGKSYNTGPNKKIEDVLPGDVYVQEGHARLVVHVAQPDALSTGQTRYKKKDGTQYVGAKKGIWSWNKKSAEENPDHLEWIYDERSTEGYRIDYLNHYGSSRPKAEMQYNRLYSDFPEGGVFRAWGEDVFRNYENWDGNTKHKDECE
jgi:hypothetical protein